MKNFDNIVEPLIKDFIPCKVSQNTVDKIKVLVDSIIEKKKNEQHHIIDGDAEKKRWMTGFGGEAALEEFLGLDIIDWSVGNSEEYHYSDLRKAGYAVGIKSVEYGKFHVIFKKSFRPEIFVFKISDTNYLICGLGTVDVLNIYQDDDLILSPKLKARGTKTGFYGYANLKKITSRDCLDEFY